MKAHLRLAALAALAALALSGCGAMIELRYEDPEFGKAAVSVRLPERRGLKK